MNNNIIKRVAFSTLPIGTVFDFNGAVYIKTEVDRRGCNVIHIETDLPGIFGDREKVEIIKAPN